MIRMGDEFLQTQAGDANPYNIDNLSTWLDWDKATSNSDVLRFTRLLIVFRNSHSSICRSRFWREDVSWRGADGSPDLSPSSHTIAYLIHGGSLRDNDVYVMVNMYWEGIDFKLQPPGPWRLVIDTNRESPGDIGDPKPISGDRIRVAARSVVVAIGV